MKKFFINSPDIDDKFHLPQVYPMCGGANISPLIEIANIPNTAKSLALTMFDPDAPTDHGWWHWMIVNISPDVEIIPRDAGNPKSEYFNIGLQTINDYGEIGYGGPCPPPGNPHRYIITVYALDVEGFNIEPTINPQLLNEYIQKYAIEKASLMALYKRGWE